MLRGWSLFWLAVALSAGGLSVQAAVTFNATGGGGTAFSVSIDATGTSGAYTVYTVTAVTPTGKAWVTINGTAPSGGGTIGTTFNLTAGTSYDLSLYADKPESGEIGSFYSYGQKTTFTATAGPTNYKVTFVIPANPTDRLVRYEVWQSGSSTGFSYSQDPGASATEQTFQPLSTNAIATLREVRTNLVEQVLPDGTSVWVVGDSDLVRVVNGGTTPVLTSATSTAASVAAPTAVVSGQPNPPPIVSVQPLPTPVSTPVAPTATTLVVMPTPKPPPNATPTGTGAVTKADLELQTNQLTDVINDTPAAVTASGNKLITAIDALNTKNHQGQSALIDAINASNLDRQKQANSSILLDTARNDSLAKLNEKTASVVTNTAATATNTAAIKTVLEDRLGPTTADASAAASAATSSAATSGTSASSAALAILPVAPTGLGYTPTVSGGSGAFLQIEIPAEFSKPGGVIVNFNPFSNSGMAAIASWFRAATEWAMLILLGRFVFEQMYRGTFEIGAARQAQGNAVAGGTGAQGTAAINAALITAAAVVALTALVSWSFGGINVPNLLSNLGTNPLAVGAGMSGDVYWFIDQLFPIPTAITAFVARAAWPVYANGVFIVYVTLCRWFIA